MKHIKIFEDFSGMGSDQQDRGIHRVDILPDWNGIMADGTDGGHHTFTVPNAIIKYHKTPATEEEIEEITDDGYNPMIDEDGDYSDYLREAVWTCDQNGSVLANSTDANPIVFVTSLSPEEFKELLEEVEPSAFDPEVYGELDKEQIEDRTGEYHPDFVRNTERGRCHKRTVTVDIVQ